MHLTNLETPCLLLDKNKMENNIRRMRDHLPESVRLRPHGKTAKSIDVMNRVMDKRCAGITVSTLKEAEYYFENGIQDITYAVGIAPNKLPRVCDLIKKGAGLTILMDHPDQAQVASQQAVTAGVNIPVLLELDSDGHRSGLKPHSQDLLLLGRQVDTAPGLELRGVLTHAGESYHCRDIDCIRALAEVERLSAVKSAELLRQHGLPCPVVSVGSTPTVLFAKKFAGLSEVRAGVYIFQDLVMAGLGVCKPEEIALSVLCSVIGHQSDKGWLITDAGWMALSRDRGTSGQQIDYGYGAVCDIHGNFIDDLIVSAANQEHGIVSSRAGHQPDYDKFPIGSLLRILPNHACASAAMHHRYQVIENDHVTENWQRINYW